MIKDDCIFCKLANGVIPTNSPYEDDKVKAIMDMGPASKGHLIVLTKNHYDNAYEADSEDLGHAMAVAGKLAKAVKKVTNCDGVNILQNNEEAAGQTVFHLHIHVIPRWKDDEIAITWKQNEMSGDELAALAKEISDNI